MKKKRAALSKKKRTIKRKQGIYDFLITLPDRIYPFAYRAQGKAVRGMQSYNHELEQALKRYGKGHFGYKLIAYRETFHLIGSILFIGFSALVSRSIFGNSDMALYVLLLAAIVAVTFQEFYLHPKKYGQLLSKGFLDWAAWVVPIIFFVGSHSLSF